MSFPGISFVDQSPALAADPNRMDIALFVGFLPLRGGEEGRLSRAPVAEKLGREGWSARVAEDDSLTDVPVRVRSIEEVETLFDTGGRVDRAVVVHGALIPDDIEITAETALVVVNLDGEEQTVTLTEGTITRADLLDVLANGLSGVSVTLGAEINAKQGLIFTRTAEGPGALTVYANPALGFAVAGHDASQRVGAPMGVALRSYYAAGGREAVIVRMGDPVPLYCTAQDRVEGLKTLIGEGYGAGASSVADLLNSTLPQLPAEYPTRDPWHGLAHLHGLPDVTHILLPDLPELVAGVAPVARSTDELPRPREVFQVCAPAPDPALNGQIRAAKPASVDADGLELWSRLAVWVADQAARITPEVLTIAAVPLIDEDAGLLRADDIRAALKTGNATRGMARKQLQLVTPWHTSKSAQDMPSGATPSDGMLAGRIAASTLAQGAWRTVAGTLLAPGEQPYGTLAGLTWDTTPQLTILGRSQRGPVILSDRTTDPETYNQANLRRLVALILRAARHRGQAAVFDPNGPLFWRDVAMPITTLLRQLHSAGALRGLREEEAFSVLCGPETMSQADIDAGRAIAEITICPAHSLEFIEISLVASGGALVQRSQAQ